MLDETANCIKWNFILHYKTANICYITIFKKQHYFTYNTVIFHSKNVNKEISLNIISNKKAKESD